MSAVVHSFTNFRAAAAADLTFLGGAGLYAAKMSASAAISSGFMADVTENLASSWMCEMKFAKLEPLLNLMPASSNHFTTNGGCCCERSFHHCMYLRDRSRVHCDFMLRR